MLFDDAEFMSEYPKEYYIDVKRVDVTLVTGHRCGTGVGYKMLEDIVVTCLERGGMVVFNVDGKVF